MKRLIAFILVLSVFSLLALVPISAEGEIFVAAGNTVLPLTDAMPIKSNGVWYIDYQCFSEGTLNVNASYNASERKLVLYNWDTTLIFDLNAATAHTVHDNVQYKAAALAAAGTVYVPVQFTAQILGFEFSYHPEIPLIRVNRPNDIPYSMFQYIAKNAIPDLLETYNAKKDSQTTSNSATSKPSQSTQETKKRNLRLTFSINDGKNLDKILTSLSSYGLRATFFIDQDALPNCENEVRRAVVLGHSLGILADNPDELYETNLKLFDIAKTKTRLVRFSKGSASLSDADVERVISLGYRLWDSDIVPAETSASKMYSYTVTQLESRPRTPVLSLSDSNVSLSALTRILKYLSNENYGSFTIGLLDTPVNAKSERR